MSYSEQTIKRLFARSQNQCAMPKCTSPIIIGDTVVGEICHIRARRKNGPRYDATMTAAQRDDYANLLLLCRTCHKLIDSNRKTFTIELLTDIKQSHEVKGVIELTPEIKKQAGILFQHLAPKRTTKAQASGSGIAIAVGGDNHGNITIKQAPAAKTPKSKYPANSIGADANLSGYVEYLLKLAYDYWGNIENMGPGRLGKKIKTKFRLGKRTRNHLSVDRYQDLVNYIINDILATSPVGKKHRKNGTKLCRTYEDWRFGEM